MKRPVSLWTGLLAATAVCTSFSAPRDASAAPPPTASSATPSPLPTPCPTLDPAFAVRGPQPAETPAYTILLRGREAAQVCTPQPAVSATPAASAMPATPAPADAPQVEFTKDSLRIRFGAGRETAFARARRANGLPMVASRAGDHDDVLRFTITGIEDPAKTMTIEVNGYYKCIVTGAHLRDDQLGNCSASPTPSPSPAPARAVTASAKAGPTPAPSPSPTPWPCPSAPYTLCGSVKVPLGVLASVFVPTPDARPQHFEFCYTKVSDAPACTRYPVAFIDRADRDWRGGGTLGKNGRDAGTGAAQRADLGGARKARRPAASANAPSSAQSGANGSSTLSGLLTEVHPFSYALRASVQIQNNTIGSALDKQTQRYLARLAGTQYTVDPAGGKLSGTASKSDNFDQVDTDVLDRVLTSPFRGLDPDALKSGDAVLTAFDATDLLGLKPFDPGKIKEVTYGGKLVWLPRQAAFGAGYYRDRAEGATGTVLHGDGTLGGITLGVTQVVANTQTASSNAYLASTFHTANTVLGALGAFGHDGAWQGFARYATIGPANYVSAVLSYADSDGGTILRSAGDSARWSGMLGWRRIDAGYDPLATAYDPFAGTQTAFARLANAITRYSSGGRPLAFETSLNAARSQAAGDPRYSTVGLTEKVSSNGLSLDAVVARSLIAPSIVARQSGSFVYRDTPGQALLNNDAAKLSLGYSAGSTLSASLGEAATHTQSCDKKTLSCGYSFAHALTATATVLSGRFVLDGSIAPGSFQTKNPGGTTTASNQIVRALVAAYHVCSAKRKFRIGFMPALTLKNNIAEDGSSFVPGTLVEDGVDVGSVGAPFALRVYRKRAYDTRFAPQPVSGNAFGIMLVSRNQTLWQAYGKGDACVKAAEEPQG